MSCSQFTIYSIRSWSRVVVALLLAGCLFGPVFSGLVAASEAKHEVKPVASEATHIIAVDSHAGKFGPAGEPTFLKRFGFAYLTAFMFFLSLGLGSLFLVIIHHLFDAQWIVPIRRFLEHIACLLCPAMLILFVPILLLAEHIYPWMRIADPDTDHALHVKSILFNKTSFYLVSVGLFLVWGFLTHRLRYWSLQQDKSDDASAFEGQMVFPETVLTLISRNLLGHTVTEKVPSALCSQMMRIHAGYGIFVWAFTLTLGAIYWVKGLQHQWFSTMYGVYYFAGSVWFTLAVSYLLALWLKNQGPLQHVVREVTFHNIATLLFAFTVFYAYIHFSQYFLIWNAALPEETFWYIQREQGSWKWVGQLIIFGHFVIPFLVLLRIDTKLKLNVIVPICFWAAAMHYMDMRFNIGPVLYPETLGFGLLDVISLGVIGGFLWILFNNALASHPPYPQRDPRIAETMGVYVEPISNKAATGN